MSVTMAWAALKSAVGGAPAVAAASGALEQVLLRPAGRGFKATAVAARTMASVKPHVPSIKFRAGGPVEAAAVLQPVQAAAPHQAASPAGPLVYEWYDTPAKFRKAAMDPVEQDCISMGGADVMWR